MHIILKKLDVGKYEGVHLTYILLLHYLGKCKKWFVNNIQQCFRLSS